MMDERDLPDDLHNKQRWNEAWLIDLADSRGISRDKLRKLQAKRVAEHAARDANNTKARHEDEKDRLEREFAALKRDSAQELLEAIPPVPTGYRNEEFPPVDGSRITELLDLLVATRNELADLLWLDREYVRDRALENIRSDAAVLLATRYLLHHGRATCWADAYRQINAGAFGWTPDAVLKWSENKAR